MEELHRSIDNQFAYNQGKNIFFNDEVTLLKFIDETIKALSSIDTLTREAEDILMDYSTSKALEEFSRINQYYTFNSQAKIYLRDIYNDLFSSIKSKEISPETIAKNHYLNLKQWLRKTNPFAEKMYSNSGEDLLPVACSEYSAEFQINLLKIDINSLLEPVLDIGCGKKGNLVNYLCKMGFVATGVDRFSFSDSNLVNSDWLEYNYGIENWGTIVSNLGFSNHFKSHNLREDGNYIEYAKKYMDIMQSLKPGGRFHYSPDLPFIEIYLDKKQFKIEKYEIGEIDFKTTVITRIK